MENQALTRGSLDGNAKTPHGGEADSLDDLGGLIDRARAGDRRALEQLMAHARPRLLAVALRTVRDRDDAEDVAQESLLKVCRHITRFEGRAAFTTWSHRIAVNTSLDWLRRQQGRRAEPAGEGTGNGVGATPRGARAGHTHTEPLGQFDNDHLDPTRAPGLVDDETPERAYARAEAGAAVHGALDRLSPAHRHVLVLRELDGESYGEIAAATRCPLGTVMSRLHHARRRLAAELAPEAQAA